MFTSSGESTPPAPGASSSGAGAALASVALLNTLLSSSVALLPVLTLSDSSCTPMVTRASPLTLNVEPRITTVVFR